MKLENREAKLDARPTLGRTLLLAAFGLVAGIMLAMSASPALAQERQEIERDLQGPELTTFTGVLQSEEGRFAFSDFFVVDEQTDSVSTLKLTPLDEGDINLSEFVGERVKVTAFTASSDVPSSADAEPSNVYPYFVTSIEVLGEGSTQNQYAEDPPEIPPEVIQSEARNAPSNVPSNAPNVSCSELGDSGEQAQQRARETLAQYPSDPNGLDADGDGIPCEFVEAPGEISYEDRSVIFINTSGSPQAGDTSGDQYDAPADEPTEGDTPTDQPIAEQVTVLPDTGGASLYTLGGGALLVAGGLLARRIVR